MVKRYVSWLTTFFKSWLRKKTSHEKEKIRISTKIGLAEAKARGVKPGAPKTRNIVRKVDGRRKEHSLELIDDIRKYTEKGLSLREIANIIWDRYQKPICPTTVHGLQKKYGIRKPSFPVFIYPTVQQKGEDKHECD